MGSEAIREALKGTRLKPVRAKLSPHYLRRLGLSPDWLLDVGVFGGTRWLYRAFNKSRTVLIDPIAECAERVQGVAPEDHEFLAVGVGNEEGELELAITTTAKGRGGAMSSFHDRVDRSADWITEREIRRVPIRTLDSIMADRPGSVGLKIDTEGHELAVLQGATETLKRCLFVIAEVSVSRRFADTPLPSRIIAECAAAGLELSDVLEMAPPNHDMPRHMDLLFTRWGEVQAVPA